MIGQVVLENGIWKIKGKLNLANLKPASTITNISRLVEEVLIRAKLILRKGQEKDMDFNFTIMEYPEWAIAYNAWPFKWDPRSDQLARCGLTPDEQLEAIHWLSNNHSRLCENDFCEMVNYEAGVLNVVNTLTNVPFIDEELPQVIIDVDSGYQWVRTATGKPFDCISFYEDEEGSGEEDFMTKMPTVQTPSNLISRMSPLSSPAKTIQGVYLGKREQLETLSEIDSQPIKLLHLRD